MKDGPIIASVAALLGDPARANMLTALMDGRALTVSELASAAGVTLQTASGHLAKLDAANLLIAEKQGRHRYFRLSGADVAQVLEGLMGLAQRTGAVRVRTGPKEEALRKARICYDHLAGERGVEMLDAAHRLRLIDNAEEPVLTDEGKSFFTCLGVDVAGLEHGKRPVCRHCLDWSERRNHLGGALGAALLKNFIARGWARRAEGRVIAFSPTGAQAFKNAFSIEAQPT
ncbi:MULTISPECIES: ArsR/SmtB family transcription factor [Brucella/Ochrobactrum group]|uniref:Winged helix-turn-helix domain-containing protein n=2 Tax=Ochrobactrum TaxID=528 RepID=A0ABD5JRH1_9HYPH|nr:MULTISPECIES: winged helix-turn-helix domain-containing protein [Brucella]MCI1001952.1 winged helix-turn-helix transcriptional regulator [Ochrobactrum sp. C6C9]RRD23295.1 ArsR family transcriptional regulator [Brucellaceae bacterium VT-16-1752]WHT42384.1 winged helix-turn-helix domain-containing protein [Ochrobactrum sp. SSR]RLL76802.1 ArsR family transcriptional regulator [[Ochrobactrum] soli]WHS31165.1 winged helix-turn-helix domain-containing protein [Brucella sp. NM4]